MSKKNKNRKSEKIISHEEHTPKASTRQQVFVGVLFGAMLVGLLYVGVSKSIAKEKDLTVSEAVEKISDKKVEEELRERNAYNQIDMAAGPQYVVFAFDGSRSISMWEDTRGFVREMNESGVPFKFTYFINPIYLLTKEEALNMYHPPGHVRGASAIGYAESKYDADKRVEQILLAHKEGNEIASHAVGHFDGTYWSTDEWLSELRQFDQILAYKGIDRKKIIRGFRAPELGKSDALYPALEQLGYKYDTSSVGLAQDTPGKKGLLWELPVASITYFPKQSSGLSMDYSLYMHQTGAVDSVVRGSPEWQKLYDETMETYTRYFYQNYEGNHAPVYIAHHFSTWNDGVYYAVLKDFAREVCGKKNVQCVTFRELQRELNAI